MPHKYNILHVQINGECMEQEPLGYRYPKSVCEGFKKSYNLESGYGDWEMFYYMESSMNKVKNGTKELKSVD